MKEICNAVKFLHERNIAHRDLKPENLLFSSKGEWILSGYYLDSEAKPNWKPSLKQMILGDDFLSKNLCCRFCRILYLTMKRRPRTQRSTCCPRSTTRNCKVKGGGTQRPFAATTKIHPFQWSLTFPRIHDGYEWYEFTPSRKEGDTEVDRLWVCQGSSCSGHFENALLHALLCWWARFYS